VEVVHCETLAEVMDPVTGDEPDGTADELAGDETEGTAEEDSGRLPLGLTGVEDTEFDSAKEV
jgi:hypothetical protein